jgi:serine protease Do
MRWLRMTAIAGVVAVAGGGVSAAVLAGGQDKDKQKEKEKTPPVVERSDRIVVSPDIQVFGAGGARIGVELREVTQEVARERKLPAVEGALVESVEDDGPAAKAGVKAGDVITGLDGERVRSIRQLQRLVTDTPAGREVKMTVMRDGKKVDLAVTPEAAEGPFAVGRLDALPRGEIGKHVEEALRSMPREFRFREGSPNVFKFEQPGGVWHFEAPEGNWRRMEPPLEAGPNRFFFKAAPGGGRLGATVQDLTPQLEEFFGVKEGVLVATVNPDSPGARAGLKAGDVVTSVNGKAVESPDALVRAIREPADGAEVTLGIVRDKKPQTLKVKLGEPSRRGVKT